MNVTITSIFRFNALQNAPLEGRPPFVRRSSAKEGVGLGPFGRGGARPSIGLPVEYYNSDAAAGNLFYSSKSFDNSFIKID
jgi:hypothetical protein